MWIRTSSGNLINLDNVVEVRKTQGHGMNKMETSFRVIVIDSSPEGAYSIASGLTEEKADAIINVLWRSIPAEDSLDVSMLVKS